MPVGPSRKDVTTVLRGAIPWLPPLRNTAGPGGAAAGKSSDLDDWSSCVRPPPASRWCASSLAPCAEGRACCG